MADGRLGQVQRFGSPGQTAFPVDGVENMQQVQVKTFLGHSQTSCE